MFVGTKLYIAIAAALALVGGGTYVYVSSSASEAPDVAEATDVRQEAEATVALNGTGSLAALLKSGQSLRCSFTHTSEGAAVEGVSYIDGGRIQSDYVMTQDGERFEAGMYSDGVTMYSWSDTEMGVMGTKFQLDQFDESAEEDMVSVEAEGAQEFAYNDEVDYACQPWRVDESVFALPEDVEFMDMSAMMQGSFDLERDGIENLPPSAPSMDELPGLDCSICADLPSGPREACLDSLQCTE